MILFYWWKYKNKLSDNCKPTHWPSWCRRFYEIHPLENPTHFLLLVFYMLSQRDMVQNYSIQPKRKYVVFFKVSGFVKHSNQSFRDCELWKSLKHIQFQTKVLYKYWLFRKFVNSSAKRTTVNMYWIQKSVSIMNETLEEMSIKSYYGHLKLEFMIRSTQKKA